VPIGDVKFEPKGSMFTREFVVSFDATPEKILSWLQSSNGTKHAFNGKTTLADTYMQLTPGGGAQFAESAGSMLLELTPNSL